MPSVQAYGSALFRYRLPGRGVIRARSGVPRTKRRSAIALQLRERRVVNSIAKQSSQPQGSLWACPGHVLACPDRLAAPAAPPAEAAPAPTAGHIPPRSARTRRSGRVLHCKSSAPLRSCRRCCRSDSSSPAGQMRLTADRLSPSGGALRAFRFARSRLPSVIRHTCPANRTSPAIVSGCGQDA